ncbi:DUF4145 domain-containing protein, partial [Acinetobacter proteolyticus]|uniref:DUF4145 domain-containing protein n=1 Tax=Acinetobacter proteolyticus TaxID=1776741 RepID=UPI001357B8CB
IRFDNRGFNKKEVFHWHVFSICSNCYKPTVFNIFLKGDANPILINNLKSATTLAAFKDINLLDLFTLGAREIPPRDAVQECPDHVPENIKKVFDEAAICLSLNCFTASGAMFRLCLDITTKELLDQWINNNQTADPQPNSAQKGKLFNRIEFLIEKNVIPPDLKDFAHHIRLDGNDAAHDGSTEKDEAEDLLDFSELFLERIYTNQKQLELAQARRLARRSS